MGVSEVAAALSSDASRGLDPAVAESRLSGPPTETSSHRLAPLWQALGDLLAEPETLLAIAIGLTCALLSGFEGGAAITILVIAFVAVFLSNGFRGARALLSLRRLDEPFATLVRGGRRVEVPARQVVPGDLLLLEVGRRVPADARLVDSYSLLVDESSVAGGSATAHKEAGTLLDPRTPFPARSNLVYAGDLVLRGRARALIVSAGFETGLRGAARREGVLGTRGTFALGAVSEKKWMLAAASVGLSVLVVLLGFLLGHEPPFHMLLAGLSLSFAAIPAELPMLVAVGLVVGAFGLSRERVVVSDLQAVENLASVTVIASDETRTLMQDRLDLKKVFPDGNRRRIIELGLLSDTEAAVGDLALADDSAVSDPLTRAFSPSAAEQGLSSEAAQNNLRLREVFSFDETRKVSSIAYDSARGVLVVARGAPESLLARSTRELGPGGEHILVDTDRDAILMAANKMAAEGLEVLGLAEKRLEKPPATQNDAEFDLTFVGLAGFVGSVKAGAKGVVAACRAAGIRPLMVTGDHPLTAVGVAMETGIQETREFIAGPELDSMDDPQLDQCVRGNAVFARVTPRTKLRIIGSLQRTGQIVAATGDDVDDASSLATADVGVAMGLRSDLVREAADIVVLDHEFATAVESTRVGRRIYANLSRGVRYYLSCKLALILACLLSVLLLAPVPFVPIQLVTMALFVDLGASVTFTAEPAGQGSTDAPRREAGSTFLDRPAAVGIVKSAAGLFLAVSAAFLLTWHYTGNLPRAESVAFVTWLLGHAFLALNMRSARHPLSALGLSSNTPMVLWVVAALALAVAAATLPAVQGFFGTVTLGPSDWAVIVPLSVAGTWWIELKKIITVSRQ